MSICTSDRGPSKMDGACYHTYSDEAFDAFTKCCGSAPVAQVYDPKRLVEEDNTRGGCFVYCPTVDDGPSPSKLEKCLNAEIDSVRCDPFGFYSAADQVELAMEQAKDTGFCQACLADIADTVEPSTTDNETFVSELPPQSRQQRTRKTLFQKLPPQSRQQLTAKPLFQKLLAAQRPRIPSHQTLLRPLPLRQEPGLLQLQLQLLKRLVLMLLLECIKRISSHGRSDLLWELCYLRVQLLGCWSNLKGGIVR